MTKEEAFKKLDQIAVECQKPDWGECGEHAVAAYTVTKAKEFLDKYMDNGGEVVGIHPNFNGTIEIDTIRSHYFWLTIDVIAEPEEEEEFFVSMEEFNAAPRFGVATSAENAAETFKALKDRNK